MRKLSEIIAVLEDGEVTFTTEELCEVLKDLAVHVANLNNKVWYLERKYGATGSGGATDSPAANAERQASGKQTV